MKEKLPIHDAGRRKILKSVAAGGGALLASKSIPAEWAKPIVDSVALPAHGQTSPQTLTFGLTCRADTNNGSLPFPQAPCSDTSQYGHEVTNQVMNVEALVDPSNDGGTVRLVINGAVSGEILNTTAVVAAGVADFGDISLPLETQQVTFAFSCVGFDCDPNPSTILTINAFTT